MERSMEVPQETTIGTSNTTLSIYAKQYTSGYDRATCTPMFIAALLTINKIWKTAQMPHN
jgi:hypothetical protein